MEFGLVLIGRAIDSLPHLVFVIDDMGKRGIGQPAVPYRMLTVSDGGRVDGAVIYRGAEKILTRPAEALRIEDLCQANDAHVRRLALEFFTPLRVKKFGDYQATGSRLTFASLVDLMVGRLAALAHCHGAGEWTAPEAWGEAARKVDVVGNRLWLQRLERYSSRHRKRLPLHGLVGTLEFRGELAPFLPLLRLGEVLQIGAGTAFGLGQYRLHTEPTPNDPSGLG
jgi:hypothetical protein